MIETIYIVRHGFRLNWVTTNWTSPTGLPRDPPLAAYGETQALELAQFFLSLPPDQRPSVILSSPYYRCLQTAKPTAEALGVPIYVEHGLSEWYSPVKSGTGLHPRPSSAHSLRSHFPQIDPSWTSQWYPSRRGESVEEAHSRSGGTLDLIVPAVERLPSDMEHRRVLLVGHAATVIALTRALVGESEMPMRAGCCSLTELSRREGTEGVLGAWKASKVADGSHLAQGAAREWGFEDIVIDEQGQVVEDYGVPGTDNEENHPVGPQRVGSTAISKM